MIYFIKARTRVKIGYSVNPEKRLKELQTGNPDKLELLLTIPGGREMELAFHAYFSRFRLEGEWFKYGSLNDIDSIKSAVFATTEWPYTKYKEPKNIKEFVTNGYHCYLVRKAKKRDPKLREKICKIVGKDNLHEYLKELSLV